MKFAAKPDPQFPSEWRLSSPVLLAETLSSRVWKVAREDGSPAIVKSLKDFPDVYDELRGGYFLNWRDGVGAVRLLAWQDRAMLLEYGGEQLLADVIASESDEAATEIAAETLARLHSPSDRALPPQLQPLRERFASLFARAAADHMIDAPSPYVEAAAIAELLLSEQAAIRPLHGDLHHDNIIHGPRGWLAIDPKGVLGDPAFDAGNLFYNPLGMRESLCLDEARIAFMAEAFGRTLAQRPARILDFALAYGCLSASWHAEDGNNREERLELGVVEAIRRVRRSL